MIRHAEEKDLITIRDIYNDAILNTTVIYEYEPFSLENRKRWFQQKKENGFPVIVFEEKNQVMGFATFGLFRARPAYQYTIEHSIYVHKEYRRKGIGKRLLKEIIQIATEQEYATLVAGIDSENRGSILMHQQFGFTYSGTIKKAGYKFGKWLDLVFYQLILKGSHDL